MRIRIHKIKKQYRVCFDEIPGASFVGMADTIEEALGQLFLVTLQTENEKYIDRTSLEIVWDSHGF